MSKVLITGFEPFDGEKINPSEILALDIAKEKSWSVVILPVSYQRAFEVANRNYQDKEIIIHLGQAGGRSQIQVERFAVNWIEASIPDTDGEKFIPQKIKTDAADILATAWDMNLEHLKQAGIGVSLSAGGYVCNNLYFKTLLGNPNKKAIFIHVPYYDEQIKGKENQNSMSLNQMKQVLLKYFSLLEI